MQQTRYLGRKMLAPAILAMLGAFQPAERSVALQLKPAQVKPSAFKIDRGEAAVPVPSNPTLSSGSTGGDASQKRAQTSDKEGKPTHNNKNNNLFSSFWDTAQGCMDGLTTMAYDVKHDCLSCCCCCCQEAAHGPPCPCGAGRPTTSAADLQRR